MRLPVSFVLLAAFVLSACTEPERNAEPKRSGAVDVRTVTLAAGEWVRPIQSYGSVEPSEEIDISVDVSATVREVLFDEGQAVKAGDVLVVLDNKKLKLKVESAKASVANARALYEQAEATLARNEEIYEKGVISRQAFQPSQSDVKSTRAVLERELAALELARQDFEESSFVSPVDGVISRRSVEPGANVGPSSSLGTIRSDGAMRVETFVSEKDINFIRVGQLGEISASGAPGKIYSGRVISLAASAEAQTGNFRVRVAIENNDGFLKDGMSARVTMQGIAQSDVITVPRRTVVDRNRRQVVYVVEGGIAIEKAPAIGIGNRDAVPVLDGLSAGEQLIVSNLSLVSDGQPVNVVGQNPAAQDAVAQ